MRVGFISIFFFSCTVAGAPGTSQPATQARPATPAEEVKEALRSLTIAQRDGDAAAIRAVFLTEDEEGARFVAAMADYAAGLVALHKAAEKAYGADGANVVTGDIKAQAADALAAIDKSTAKPEGDKATVIYGGAKDPPVQLVKVGGRWKLPLKQLLDGVDKAAEQQRLKELLHQARLAEEMARELGNGKYKEGPSRAAAVWRARLLAPEGAQEK
jgi:hypothetical protein